jgi:hypothetical protein
MATGANATINLNAVDNTRAAFLGVQRSLQQVERQSAMVSRSILRTGLGIVGGSGLALMLSREIRNVITNIESIPGVPDHVQASVLALKQRFEEVKTTAQGAIAASIGWFAQLSQNLGIAAGALVYGIDAATDAYDQMNAAQRDALDTARAKALEEQLKPIRAELKRVQTAAAQAMLPFTGVALRGREQIDALRESMSRIQNELAHTGSNTEEGLRRQIELYGELRTVAQALTRAEEQRTRAAREAAKILSEGFEEAIFSGKKLSDVIKQLAIDLVRLAFRQAITNPLAASLGGFIKNIFTPRAMGGPVSSGSSYLVGERGPEIFTPSSAGNIISNQKSMSGGKGGSTYYIDARGADQTGLARLEAMIRQTQAAIVPMALGAMQDARNRGSAFAV